METVSYNVFKYKYDTERVKDLQKRGKDPIVDLYMNTFDLPEDEIEEISDHLDYKIYKAVIAYNKDGQPEDKDVMEYIEDVLTSDDIAFLYSIPGAKEISDFFSKSFPAEALQSGSTLSNFWGFMALIMFLVKWGDKDPNLADIEIPDDMGGHLVLSDMVSSGIGINLN